MKVIFLLILVFQVLNFVCLYEKKFFFRRHFNSTDQIPYGFLDGSESHFNTCSPVDDYKARTVVVSHNLDRKVGTTTTGYIPAEYGSPLHFVVTYPHYLDCCCSEPEDCVPSSPRSISDPRFEPSYPRVYSRGLCSWRNGKPRDTVISRNSIIRSRC